MVAGKVITGWEDGLDVTAAEVDRASVASEEVAQCVAGRDGDVERGAGRGGIGGRSHPEGSRQISPGVESRLELRDRQESELVGDTRRAGCLGRRNRPGVTPPIPIM